MRVHTHFKKAATALFGETPLGNVGAGLQWLTLSIVLVPCMVETPPSWRLAAASTGVAALLVGIVLAWRGKSLGPLIVIPGVLGIAMILLLAATFYPFRLLTDGDYRAKR